MRIRELCLLLSLLGSYGATAQSPKQGAQRVASQLCTCINQQHQNLDANIKVAFGQLLRYQLDEEPKQVKRYLNSLSERTRLRLNQQLELLKQQGPLTQPCLVQLERTMKALDTSHPGYESLTGAGFNQLILDALQEQEDGKLASILWEMGLRAQRLRGPKQQVNISSRRSQ